MTLGFPECIYRLRYLLRDEVFMSEPKSNNERKLISVVGMIIWRWGSFIAFGLAAYGSMWVKLNAPSRAQFDKLTEEVQGLREDMIRITVHKERTDKIESRLDKNEDRILELERRATPRRIIP